MLLGGSCRNKACFGDYWSQHCARNGGKRCICNTLAFEQVTVDGKEVCQKSESDCNKLCKTKDYCILMYTHVYIQLTIFIYGFCREVYVLVRLIYFSVSETNALIFLEF